MIDKPDPEKDAGRTDSPGVKRPHATLDLKATEVKPPPQTGASTASASAAASASTPPPGAKASAGSSAPPGKSSDTGAPPKAAAASPPAAAKSGNGGGSGGGSFLSHLAAGVIGGGLVYLGGALLGTGSPSVVSDEATSALAARVAALEAAPKGGNGDGAALDARIGNAESRLAKLDEIEQGLAALRETQGTLQAEAKALSENAQRGGGAETTARIAKLEEQLAMISAAAEGTEGRVPQLAAITGKISDLETALATQVGELRKSLPDEVEQRLAATAEASEAAKAAAGRLERDLGQVRTEQARGLQKADAAKADTDRLSASVEAVKEESVRLSNVVGELRSSVDAQLKSVAKPGDVSAAVEPVAAKLAAFEQSVQGVVQSEESRRQNAERIVLSLELSKLKRALDRGQGHGYAAELAEVQAAAGGTLDLSALERFKDTGVATVAELKASFRPVMNAVIDADLEPADGSVIDRLLAGAKSVVRVRKISHDAGDTSTEAIVARIETALNEGRLGDVIAQAEALPQKAQAPIEDWLIKATARHSVDQAIASVEDRLKASLAGAPEAGAGKPEQPAPAPEQN